MTSQTRDIVFLFGAGASFGAGDILPGNPPLGTQLYQHLAAHYVGSWGSLPQDAQAAFAAENFETGMALLYERYAMAVPTLMRHLAVYLVQYRPCAGRSLYCQLIERLRRRGLLDQVFFSTLNYDCVLEFSLLRQGLVPSYFDDRQVPLWKLHGSCNWFSHAVKASADVLYSKDVIWEGGVEAFLDIGEVVRNCLVNQGLAPVMSLYMEGKPLQVSPSVVHELHGRWLDAVGQARIIACVGVRPWVADKHIWDPLAKAGGELLFIGHEAEFEAWTAEHRDGPSTYLAPYFHSGFQPLIRRLQ